MPSNLVVINGSEGLTWQVGDSKMEELMEFLHKIGIHQQPEKSSKSKWRDPESEEIDTPEFVAIWNCIKTWDINVPDQYEGYCGATGNHVVAILDSLKKGE